jgi:hypothetical protein
MYFLAKGALWSTDMAGKCFVTLQLELPYDPIEGFTARNVTGIEKP